MAVEPARDHQDEDEQVLITCFKEPVQLSGSTCSKSNVDIAEMRVARFETRDHSRILRKLWFGLKRLALQSESGAVPWVCVPPHEVPDFVRALGFASIKVQQYLRNSTFDVEPRTACNSRDCTPSPPPVRWIVSNDTPAAKYEPYQLPDECRAFEDDLKASSPAFRIEARVRPTGVADREGWVINARLVVNPVILAHRALDHLASNSAGDGEVRLAFGVQPRQSESLVPQLGTLHEEILPVSRSDSHVAPPSFARNEQTLTEGQMASVRWMLFRERDPVEFVEREVEEEVVPSLNLRLVGTASRAVRCGGGLIADDVGYGKTVCTLALIDLQREYDLQDFEMRKKVQIQKGLKALNATLIIVPDHLVVQWSGEIITFLGYANHEVVSAKADGKALQQNIDSTRIIVVSEKLLEASSYLKFLASVAGQASATGATLRSTRAHSVWHDACVTSLKDVMSAVLGQPEDSSKYARLANGIEKEMAQRRSINAELRGNRVFKSTRTKKPNRATQHDEEDAPKGSLSSKVVASCWVPPTAEDVQGLGRILEAYSFSRIVCDEVSYSGTAARKFIASASARHKWLLSGTPPTESLKGVHDLAKLLGIHLARPVALRDGLPKVTRGPEQAPQTVEEQQLSYSKTMSEMFSIERHEAAGRFLRNLSCANPADLASFKVRVHVLVCDPGPLELAQYLNFQEDVRAAGMDADNLSTQSRQLMMKGIDHDDIASTSRETATQGMIAMASVHGCDLRDRDLPNGATQPVSDATKLRRHRCELLKQAGQFARQRFQKVLWLAHHALTCPAANATEVDESMDTIRSWVQSLRCGHASAFGGVDGLIAVFKALFPHSGLRDVDFRRRLKAFPETKAAEDRVLFNLSWVDPVGDYDGADKSKVDEAIAKLTDDSDTWWAGYFLVEPEDIDKMPDTLKVEDDEGNRSEVKNTQIMGMVLDAAKAALGVEGDEPPTNDVSHFKAVLKRLVQHRKVAETASQTSKPTPTVMIGDRRIDDKKVLKLHLERECQARGIKPKANASKQALIDLIEADERDELDPEFRIGLELKSLRPKQRVPILGQSRSVRGRTISQFQDTLIYALEELTKTLAHVGVLHKQLRVACCFERLDRGARQFCRVCAGSEDLHLVLACGHLLCKEHRSKGRCGEGAHGCTVSLNRSTMSLATLRASRPRVLGSFKHFGSPDAGGAGADDKLADKPAGGRKDIDEEVKRSAGDEVEQPVGNVGETNVDEHQEVNRPAGDEVKQPAGDEVKQPVGDEVNRPVGDVGDMDVDEHELLPGVSSKFANIIKLVKTIPEGDQVLVFAQHNNMLTRLEEVFAVAGINCASTSKIVKSAGEISTEAGNEIRRFQKGEVKVLILKINTSEASGTNLYHANHVIFASPLAVNSQHQYDSFMKQACGRAVRRKQEKTVHIYHCVTSRTVEVDILEFRTGKRIVVEEGRALGTLEGARIPKTEHDGDELQGEDGGVASIITEAEVWRALDETDYATMITAKKAGSWKRKGATTGGSAVATN